MDGANVGRTFVGEQLRAGGRGHGRVLLAVVVPFGAWDRKPLMENAISQLTPTSSLFQSFDDSSLIPRLLQHYHSTPPITKIYLTSSFATALFSFILNNNQFPKILTLQYSKLLTGQFWRPITQFLNLGPLSLSYFLTLQFLWTYMSSIEKLLHTTPTTFINLLILIPSLMVISYGVLGLNVELLGHNFSTFLVYLWSRLHEGMEVNLMELFTLRAEVLPWFFLGE